MGTTEREIRMIDIKEGELEIKFSPDRERCWINVDGICRLRIYDIKKLMMDEDFLDTQFGEGTFDVEEMERFFTRLQRLFPEQFAKAGKDVLEQEEYNKAVSHAAVVKEDDDDETD